MDPAPPTPVSEQHKHACTEEGCSHRSKHPSGLQQHIREKHTKERPFPCLICKWSGEDKAFPRKGSLNRHMENVHDIVVTLRPRRRSIPEGKLSATPDIVQRSFDNVGGGYQEFHRLIQDAAQAKGVQESDEIDKGADELTASAQDGEGQRSYASSTDQRARIAHTQPNVQHVVRPGRWTSSRENGFQTRQIECDICGVWLEDNYHCIEHYHRWHGYPHSATCPCTQCRTMSHPQPGELSSTLKDFDEAGFTDTLLRVINSEPDGGSISPSGRDVNVHMGVSGPSNLTNVGPAGSIDNGSGNSNDVQATLEAPPDPQQVQDHQNTALDYAETSAAADDFGWSTGDWADVEAMDDGQDWSLP